MVEAHDHGSARLHPVTPDGPLYRVARRPNPWAWPDWANAGGDGTFGNRWDDPNGLYRVLYASSCRLGAFMEVLARFRPDPHILQALEEIEDEEESPSLLLGDLHTSWLEQRCIGEANVEDAFIDVGHSCSLAHLREALASRLVHYGLDDLDAATVRLSVPRNFTQEISRYVYDRSTPEGQRRFGGIAYRSRLGDEFQNWAVFESPGSDLRGAGSPENAAIDPGDPDLVCALETLVVRLVSD